MMEGVGPAFGRQLIDQALGMEWLILFDGHDCWSLGLDLCR